MFLIFHELRADVLPVDDIGLQRAIALHYNDGERVDAGGHPRARARVAALPQRRDVVSVALARPGSGRVLIDRARGRVDAALLRAHPLSPDLTPDRVLDALDSVGLRGDGRLLALSSYENRVYQVGIDDARRRSWPSSTGRDAGRTRRSLEEHAFVAELAAREIPVVAPLALAGAHAARVRRLPLRRLPAVRRPRAGARRPGDARMDGPLPRPHPRGRRAARRSAHRPALDLDTFGVEPRDWLLAHDFIPPDLLDAWRSIAAQALDGVRRCFDRAGDVRTLRLHGDCHAGNVLWIEHGATRGPHFVDFDDARMGPAVQDLWMLLSGDRAEMTRQLGDVLDRLRGLLRVRSARAPPRRGAAHAAPPPLLGVARAALGRSRVSRRVPVVQHPALLAGPHPRTARAGRADGRAAAAV